MIKYCFPLLTGLLLASCGEQEKPKAPIEWSQEKSSTFSKTLAMEETMDIRVFLEAHPKLKMTETGSGLRYFIYEKGTGPLAESGMLAEVKFKICRLDGKVCYQTDSLETETFKIDKSDVESGVQEGIKLMHIGDKAKFIVPSHLAHGLSGDFDKIPPLTTLVVDLELLSLRKRKI